MRSMRPILLVEDNLVDILMIQRALKRLKITNQLDVAHNGEEALTHLRNLQSHLPCIILLDLNMPLMNGLEFLIHAKQDPILRSIPVVILTSSREQQDRTATFEKSVAGYMVKPGTYEQLVEVLRTLDLYWTLSETAWENYNA